MKGPPDPLKPKFKPPKLENLHPPPKILKTDSITASVYPAYKEMIVQEAYKRGMTITNLILAALDMYLNPHTNFFVEKGHKDMAILPINRESKGEGATPMQEMNFRIIVQQYRESVAQARTQNKSIQELLLKPIGSFDNEIEFKEVEVL